MRKYAKAKLWSDALPGFNTASPENAAALVAVTFVPGESGHMGDTPYFKNPRKPVAEVLKIL